MFGYPESLQRWVPTAECLFQGLHSTREVNESIHAPLLRAAEQLEQHVARLNPSQSVLVGMPRVELPMLPTSTVRESIANALVNRDYSELGPITVQLTETEFRVTSPGGLPPSVTLNNLLERSVPRSPCLAHAFMRAGIVDRAGRGIRDMYNAQLRAGRDLPDYSRTTSHSVTVTIPNASADLDFVRFVLAYENAQQAPLTLEQMMVLHHIRAAGPTSVKELADEMKRTSAGTRGLVHGLVGRGLLTVTGGGSSRRYQLASQFYQLAQDRNAYVRVLGVTPIQQENMVTQYLETYKTITRSQAASLCQISSLQARRLQLRIAAEEKLILKGAGRGAHYVLADS